MTGDEAPLGSNRGTGRYANYFEIGYSAFEVLLTFGQRYSESGAPTCHTMIVTTPSHAKTLLEMLDRSIRELEDRYGPVDAAGPDATR